MLQDLTQVVLARALDASALRHRAIANNIANVETPNFHRQDVAFEEQLRGALDASGSADDAVDGVQPELVPDASQPVRENGNNVDLDGEMARMAENTVHYEAVLQSMSIKQSMLRTAIYEGRR